MDRKDFYYMHPRLNTNGKREREEEYTGYNNGEYPEKDDDRGYGRYSLDSTDTTSSEISASPILGKGRLAFPPEKLRRCDSVPIDGTKYIPDYDRKYREENNQEENQGENQEEGTETTELIDEKDYERVSQPSENYVDSQPRKRFFRRLKVYLLIGLLMCGIVFLIDSNGNLTDNHPYFNSTGSKFIDPGYPSEGFFHQQETPPVNWWTKYLSECCVSNNSNNLYRTHDCSANYACYDYLENWLGEVGQTFYTSNWTSRCCYEYRTIGEFIYDSYCSFTCLNTLRNL